MGWGGDKIFSFFLMLGHMRVDAGRDPHLQPSWAEDKREMLVISNFRNIFLGVIASPLTLATVGTEQCSVPTTLKKRGGVVLFFAIILLLSTAISSIAAENPTFDPDHFFGQRIAFQGTKSANVRTIRLVLQFPRGYKMFFHAKPSMKLFTKEGVFIKEFPIEKNSDSYPFDEGIPSEQLYAQIGLYYCKEGEEGMCLLKNLLFEITLDKNLSADDIFLTYTITE